MKGLHVRRARLRAAVRCILLHFCGTKVVAARLCVSVHYNRCKRMIAVHIFVQHLLFENRDRPCENATLLI